MTHLNSIDPQQWVNSHADYLYAFAVTRVNDESLARDLVQETFLAALERLDRFEGRSSERTWLTAILKNKIMDVFRRKASVLQSLQDCGSGGSIDFFETGNGHWKEGHQPKVFGIEQYDELANKEFNHVLEQCLKKLPALWLAVFTLRFIDEQTTEIICDQLAVSASNFWVIIHRAKVNLRACLQKNW